MAFLGVFSLWSNRRTGGMLHLPKLGLPYFSPDWIVSHRAGDGGFPARVTRETEKWSPGSTLTSADEGLFWKNNPGSHFIFAIEILCGGSKWRSVLWNSPIFLTTPMPFGGSSTDIHKVAETANKQCLLLTKLWQILPWSLMCVLIMTIASKREREIRVNSIKRPEKEGRARTQL